MKITKKVKPNAPPDLLPLMDCMFILLIYFIFSMMMMIINVNIPLSIPKQELEDSNQVIYAIEIKKNGSYIWNKEDTPVGFDVLYTNIENLIESGYVPSIFITTDKNVEYGSFINILDMLRELEIKKITLDTGLDEFLAGDTLPTEGEDVN